MNIGNLDISASAMGTFATGMNVIAHNIANVSTAGFQPQRADYADAPHGQGVRLNAVMQGGQPARPGNDLRADTAAYAREAAQTGSDPLQMHPSGTELTREIPAMITTQHAFDANAVLVRTADDMMGSLLDIKV